MHHITNYVTVNDCANITICAGGAPVMADERGDAEDIAAVASCLVLNMGTVNRRTLDSMLAAGKAANDAGVPVVFDPVGVGASRFRNSSADAILSKVDVAVIKGNAGEMGVLSGMGGGVRGVDSACATDPAASAKVLAKRYGCIAAATGPKDYVSDGSTVMELSNGSDMLGLVSGTGCMTASVVGCYTGACGPSLDSVCAAITAFCIASENAADGCGPGTFKMRLFDKMHSLTAESLDSGQRIGTLSSKHLQLAGDLVDHRFQSGSYAHAGDGARCDLGPACVCYDATDEPGGLRHGLELEELPLVVHLENDLPLTLGHPSVQHLRVLLPRRQCAAHRGVRSLCCGLAFGELEVVADQDGHLGLVCDAEKYRHIGVYRPSRYNGVGVPALKIKREGSMRDAWR